MMGWETPEQDKTKFEEKMPFLIILKGQKYQKIWEQIRQLALMGKVYIIENTNVGDRTPLSSEIQIGSLLFEHT